MIASRLSLAWESPSDLVINGTRFFLTVNADEYLSLESTARRIVVAKSREMVEDFARTTAALDARRVVHIGISKGGSSALLASLFRPERLTALELSVTPVQALTDFIRLSGLEDVVKPRYGFDQSDASALQAVLEEDHGDARLDLVVDDGSHLYRETRASFEVLFPRLRPGGKYMIEDWAWAHYPGSFWQSGGGWFHDRPALTNLALEILMTLGSHGGLISEVKVLRDTIEVVRGSESSCGPVRLETCDLNRGQRFRPLL